MIKDKIKKQATQQNSRTKNSALNFVTGVGGQFLTTILSFVVRTVFIQKLGVEYLGIGGLFMNVLQLLSLTQLGMDTAINYKLYKPLAERDETRVRVLMKFYKQAYRVIGLVIFLLGIAAIPGLPYIIKDYDRIDALHINIVFVFLLYLLQSVSSYLFFAYRTVIIRAAQKSYMLNVVDYFINLAQGIAQLLVLYLLHDFTIYVATVVVFTLLKNGINALIAERMFAYAFLPQKESMSRTEIKSVFKDCMALFVYRINSVVLKATDNIVLSSFIGLSIVGLYSNYLMFYSVIRQFISHIFVSVKAGMGNLFATGNLERSYFMFEVINFITVLCYGTALVGITICANELIEVWIGSNYTIPQPFSLLIGIELIFSGLKVNLGQIRTITGAFRQMWYRPLMGIIINVVVSVVGAIYIGIYGVILGTITADFLTNFMVDPRVIHKHSFKGIRPVSYYYKKNLAYMVVLASVCLADYYLCGILNTGMPLLNLLLHVLICLISVPTVFVTIYWRTDVCQYLYHKFVKRNK